MPVDILQDKKLNHTQKILYCEIVSLCQVDKCYASNKHFAASLDISERSVQRNLEALKEAGYIRVNVIRDEQKMVTARIINVVKIDYKLPHDDSDEPHVASDVTPHVARGQNLTTPASYINTHLNTQRESTHTHEVFDLNETLVEKIDKAPSPLEKMLNSINYRSKFEALAKKHLKSKTTEAALKEMSVQMKQQKNYHRWYKSERTIFEKFEAYFLNPNAFTQYKK